MCSLILQIYRLISLLKRFYTNVLISETQTQIKFFGNLEATLNTIDDYSKPSKVLTIKIEYFNSLTACVKLQDI